MPGEGKNPVSDQPEQPPSAYLVQPLGALSRLPDVLLGLLCSYLSGRELCRLGASCAGLYRGPHCVMPGIRVRRWLLKSESESEEEMGRGRSAASRLARRAAGASVRELHINDHRLIEPFLSALRAEEGLVLGALTFLRLALVETVTKTEITEGVKQAVAESLADGRLPMLRELQLHAPRHSTSLPRLQPMWRALEQGACPTLKSLRLEAPQPEVLVGVTAAVLARRGRCEELTELNIDFDYSSSEEGGEWSAAGVFDALDGLLRQLSPSLETLCLDHVNASAMPTALSALFEPSCRVLQSLRLSSDLQGDAPSCGDVLVHALARGAAPGLRQLLVKRVRCSESEEPWRELGEAMQVEGGCLCRLQSLQLQGVFQTLQQVGIFTRALGSGHGCPELQTLSLSRARGQLYAAFLAPAFCPPRGLPLLKRLDLHGSRLDDGDLLLDALRDRPHAHRELEELALTNCRVTGLGGVAAAMQDGGPLAALKQLDMHGSEPSAEVQQWAIGFIAALASGAGRQLETIKWPYMATVEPINLFLRALAVDGACPRLRSFRPNWISYQSNGAAGLDVQSLGAVLAGRAACSATMTVVDLQAFKLSSAELTALAACLGTGQAVQLQVLRLNVGGTCLRGPLDLLSVLGGRAGSGLKRLHIELRECNEQEGKEVVDRLVDMIEAGRLPTNVFPLVDFASPYTGHSWARVLRAVRSRVEAL